MIFFEEEIFVKIIIYFYFILTNAIYLNFNLVGEAKHLFESDPLL